MSDERESRIQEEDRFANLKIAFGLERDPTGRPPFIWAERWNAPVMMVCIAIGAPLLGMSEFSEVTKLWILVGWLMLYVFYMLLEGRELLGQMEGRGAISAPQARRQIRTAQLPHLGTFFAVSAWIVSLAYFKDEPDGGPIHYGWIEATFLVCSTVIQLISNYMFNGLALELSMSAPRGQRSEQRLPRG